MDVITLRGGHDAAETPCRLLAVVLRFEQVKTKRRDMAVGFAETHREVDNRELIMGAGYI